MSKNIHRQKLFNGRATAEEVHSQLAFPAHAKCTGCNARPDVRAIVMLELKELRTRQPDIDQIMLVDPVAFMSQIVQIRGSDGRPVPYFRASVTYACKACAPTMERQLAKHMPSWAIVEINRCRPSRFVSGVAGGSSID